MSEAPIIDRQTLSDLNTIQMINAQTVQDIAKATSAPRNEIQDDLRRDIVYSDPVALAYILQESHSDERTLTAHIFCTPNDAESMEKLFAEDSECLKSKTDNSSYQLNPKAKVYRLVPDNPKRNVEVYNPFSPNSDRMDFKFELSQAVVFNPAVPINNTRLVVKIHHDPKELFEIPSTDGSYTRYALRPPRPSRT